MDNTQLQVGAGGDTIRTLDKTGTGAPKTEVVALDLGGGDGRSEYIGSYPLPVKLDDVPVDDDGNPLASLSPATLDALEILFRQTMAAQGYPITPTEIKAGVVPVDLTYPPLYVDRYLKNAVPNSTDMAPGFSIAFKVAQIQGGTIRYGATAPYATLQPINFTQAAAPSVGAVTLQCDTPALDSTLPMSINASHTGHVFDCTGTGGLTFKNVSISTLISGNVPQTAIFLARNNSANPNGPGVVSCRFENCNVVGRFNIAAYYNFGAESDEIIGGTWYNADTGGASAVLIYTANNIKAQTSSFVTVNTNAQSTRDHKIIGGVIQNQSSDAAADCIYLEGIESLRIFSTFFVCRLGGTGGRSYIFVDMSVAASNAVHLYGMSSDHSVGADPTYGIDFSNHAQTPTAWTIDGCYFSTATNAILAGASAILDNFYVRNLREATSVGLNCGTLQNSTWDGSNPITTVTCSKNFLIDIQANLTLGTVTNTIVFNRTLGEGRFAQLTGIAGGAVNVSSTVAGALSVDSTSANGAYVNMSASGTTENQVGSGLAILGTGSNQDTCLAARGSLFLATNFATFFQGTTAKDIIARGISICKRATAIETRTSTVTLTNSTQLTYAIPVAGTYAFEVVLFSYFTTAVTNGITANVNYSGTFTAVGSYLCGSFCNGTTTDVAIQPVQVSATVNNALAGLTLATYGASVTSAAPAVHKVRGNLIATGTGTLAFAFAQASSGVNTANLGVGSYMTVTQLS